MKRTIFSLFFILTAFSLFSQSGETSLFKIILTTSDDIEGTVTTSKMNIFDTLEVSDFSVIKFNLCKQHNPKNTFVTCFVAYIEIIYIGQNWRFIDTLQLKIDDKLFTITPTSNDRKPGKAVTEICTAMLTKEMITALQTCKSIILQANGRQRGTPYTVKSEGMQIINEYMEEFARFERDRFRGIYADIVYPPIAFRSGIEGRVILDFFVDEEGNIQQVVILQENPHDRSFGEAAVKAFVGKKVEPAIANGKAVSVRYRYPVSFRINK